MDNPLWSLDFHLNTQLTRAIITLQQSLGFTLLYISHNQHEVNTITIGVISVHPHPSYSHNYLEQGAGGWLRSNYIDLSENVLSLIAQLLGPPYPTRQSPCVRIVVASNFQIEVRRNEIKIFSII